MFFEREFNVDGSLKHSSPQFAFISLDWGLTMIILDIIYIALIGFSYLVQRANLSEEKSLLAYLPRRFGLIISFLWSLFVLLYFDIQVRYSIIARHYATATAFGNVVLGGPGYYLFLIAVVLNVVLIFTDHQYTVDQFKSKVQTIQDRIPTWLKSTTFIQYATFHVSILLFMMVSYSVYFNDMAFWRGISYYTELFYTYGLNGRLQDIPAYYNLLTILFLPFAYVALCFYFITAGGAGFAPNGAPISQTVPEPGYDVGTNFQEWGYFSKDVPFAEHWLGSPNFNGFYVSLFVVTIVSFIIGGLIARKYAVDNKTSNVYKFLILGVISSWIFSFTFSILSAPVFVLWGGILQSVVIERDINRFIVYRYLQPNLADNGYYHPLSTFWIILIFELFLAITASLISYVTKSRSNNVNTHLK